MSIKYTIDYVSKWNKLYKLLSNLCVLFLILFLMQVVIFLVDSDPTPGAPGAQLTSPKSFVTGIFSGDKIAK